jgi:hypothetical protein
MINKFDVHKKINELSHTSDARYYWDTPSYYAIMFIYFTISLYTLLDIPTSMYWISPRLSIEIFIIFMKNEKSQ